MRSSTSRLLLLVLAACGRLNKNDPDASTAPQQCEAAFDMKVNKQCVSASDCTLLAHPDCCGPVEIGIATVDPTAEAAYEACENMACGARGCSHPEAAEDGTFVMNPGDTIVPTCNMNQCSSTVIHAMP